MGQLHTCGATISRGLWFVRAGAGTPRKRAGYSMDKSACSHAFVTATRASANHCRSPAAVEDSQKKFSQAVGERCNITTGPEQNSRRCASRWESVKCFTNLTGESRLSVWIY